MMSSRGRDELEPETGVLTWYGRSFHVLRARAILGKPR